MFLFKILKFLYYENLKYLIHLYTICSLLLLSIMYARFEGGEGV